MNLITISEISKTMSISTRTLRYYEQLGLIESVKKDDYAYRTYDEAMVTRLQQILVLRKLRIPLKQIGVILQSENTAAIIDTFRQNLAEVDDEITALSTIRDIINSFIARLNESVHQDIKQNLLDDTTLLEAVDALTVQRIPLKDEKTTEDLQAASEKLNRLTDRDVRIVYLPPMTVAAYQFIGDGPEGPSDEMIQKFIKDVNLKNVYPASRHYGFNHPNPGIREDGKYGYERWMTIPGDMEVPEPLERKHFAGGLYAAYMILPDELDGQGWHRLWQWAANHESFEMNLDPSQEIMNGLLEEHLNYFEWNAKFNQIDLLMPIKPKFAATTKHPQEQIIETFNYNGIPVEVVEWDATIWCGKIGYAENDRDEPDVGPILSGYMALPIPSINERLEPDWDVCMSVNYLSKERPNGVMFADLVGTENQPEGFDVYKLPAGQYLRLAINEDSAKALGSQLWEGGIPPYEWVGEQLAPQFGYRYGNDRLPVFEYYGYYKPEKNAHEFRYLYVPVS
jgi:DNA-binding transcriptional MerR regulator/DNA gyrase inhibitor GyrI